VAGVRLAPLNRRYAAEVLPGSQDAARQLDQHANPHDDLWALAEELYRDVGPDDRLIEGFVLAMGAATGRPVQEFRDELARRCST
jgi:hypothetical protein